ncbi:centrosomal protein of 97 kDa isoform X2 [Ambystoma mexicanum]|uniref:centrosomal protein of 97 kDa isoform X2 n=1 Tax=Ambystoma mexicanum TaxID=8296 RepID=UPI0037E92A32
MAEKEEALEPLLTSGSVIDLSDHGLQQLGPTLLCPLEASTVILDKNQLIKLAHLDKLKHLMQTVDQINSCTSLDHLDLSDNSLSQIGDLSKLIKLKTLLLHGNIITSLHAPSAYLPHSLTIFSLAENEISDLNEISFLASLQDLEQLSIMNNPCVMATQSVPGFDYRPYIVSWCLNLQVLDGYVISQKESLKAEWLHSQGKARSYRPGEHVPLVNYLASVCPLTYTFGVQNTEDAKLEHNLNKRRFHQRQLNRQHREKDNPLPTPDTALSPPLQCRSLSHGQQSSIENESIVNLRFGASLSEDCSSDARNLIPSGDYSGKLHHNDLFLEDIQTDEDKLNRSLLSPESTFMPVVKRLTPVSPIVEKSISGIKYVQQPATTLMNSLKRLDSDMETTNNAKRVTGTEKGNKEEGLPSKKPSILSNNCTHIIKVCSPCTVLPIGEMQRNVTANEEETLTEILCLKDNCELPPSMNENSDWLSQRKKAATKLQACWRGFCTRNYNPKAIHVRYEIRLSRMQKHILFLNEEVSKLQKEKMEEKMLRLVEEEAVKLLWNKVESLEKWKRSVNQRLDSHRQPSVPTTVSFFPAQLLSCSCNSSFEAATDLALCPEVKHEKLSWESSGCGFDSVSMVHGHYNDNMYSAELSVISGSNDETTRQQQDNPYQQGQSDVPEDRDDRKECGESLKDSSKWEKYNSPTQQYLKSTEQSAIDDDGTCCSDPMENYSPHTTNILENQNFLTDNGFPEESHTT